MWKFTFKETPIDGGDVVAIDQGGELHQGHYHEDGNNISARAMDGRMVYNVNLAFGTAWCYRYELRDLKDEAFKEAYKERK